MNYLNRLLAVASAAFFIAGSALAQNAGMVTNHAFAIGKGAGQGGYTSLLCGSAQLAVGQSAADPICKTITGDVTITAAGVTAIGATKVTNAMLATMNANTTKCNATGGAAVPTDCTASTTRTNIGLSSADTPTFLSLVLSPGADSVTPLTINGAAGASRLTLALDASGNTLLRTQNSTQLRLGVNSADFWILTTDGSFGVAQQAAPVTPSAGFARLYLDSTSKVFSGKSDAGTISNMVVPSSAVANQFLTGIGTDGVITRAQPSVSNISGFGTGVATALGVNVGSAGAPVLFNGAGGTPSSMTATNLTGTAAGLTAGNVSTNANLTGDVTSVGNATTLTNAPVIAKVLTAFSALAGTVSSSDSILGAFQKIVGNIALKANIASPTFTGTPAAPTAAPSNNSTQIATTAYVDAQVAGGVAGVASIDTQTGAFTTASGVKSTSKVISVDGSFEFRNRIINPSGHIWQSQNTGAAAITDVTYAFDQWYGLTEANGVTASQQTVVENGTPYMMRLLQANASAQRFGIAQPIEYANIVDLRGQAVVLSARVRMSASTTLRYAIVEWTGAADGPTKDVVNNWASATFTTGNFFISTTTTIVATGSTALTANTLASISLTGTISGSMNNLIVFFWTDSAQAQNVTLDIGKVQLEAGLSATNFAPRPKAVELTLCQRYYWKTYDEATAPGTVTTTGQRIFRPPAAQTFMDNMNQTFPASMRGAPGITWYSPDSGASGNIRRVGTADAAVSTTLYTGEKQSGLPQLSSAATAGDIYSLHAVANSRL